MALDTTAAGGALIKLFSVPGLVAVTSRVFMFM